MDRDRQFQTLAQVVEIANTSVDVGERLESILRVVSQRLGARLAVLFLQEHRKSRLVRAHLWPPQALPEEPVGVEFGRCAVGKVAFRREPLIITSVTPGRDPTLDHIAQPGEGVALFPVMDDNRLYAVLALVFPAFSGLKDDDLVLMQMVAREMAGAIRNFRLYLEAKKRITELNVLSDLGRTAVSTIDVEPLLENVASICAKLLGARGGVVEVSHGNGHPHTLRATYGRVPTVCLGDKRCQDFCTVQETRISNLPVRTCRPPSPEMGFAQGMCVALTFKGPYRGHLCVYDKVVSEPGTQPGFSADDQDLMASMSSMVSAALENALTFQRVEELAQRNEEMVGALATLFEISTVLMTTVDFDQTVQIILQAVIHPAGLDHDRVILFLLDEHDHLLRPVADLAKPPQATHTHELVQTLSQIKDGAGPALSLDPSLAGLKIALDPKQSILAQTVLERRAIRVNQPQQHPQVSHQFLAATGPHPFVSVPMFAKGKTVGALVVNNQRSQRPFGDRDLKLLAMLANLGGLAVENSRLYQRLEYANRELAQMRNRLLEADKLAALGEVAAGVAHEIRNPLVSIGGFTRRIRKKVGQDSAITRYLDVIIDEVNRLERTLNEMLDFSTDTGGNFDEQNLSHIMDHALELLSRELEEHHIQVVRDYAPELPKVFCDERQIKHVFLNLYLNAIQAMGRGGGKITLRSYLVTREGKQFVAGEVSDTGGGIPLDVIHKIFNPFFTTKDEGSGLGLSIVHKIVTRHFGQVEVHNREGEGASFLVTLPAAEEGRAYLK